MNTAFKPGKVLTLTAPSGGVVSGKLYKIGSLIVVATHDAAQSTPFEAATSGVVEAEKATTAAWTLGAILYFDASAGKVTTDSNTGTNLKCGYAAAAADESATTGKLYLVL